MKELSFFLLTHISNQTKSTMKSVSMEFVSHLKENLKGRPAMNTKKNRDLKTLAGDIPVGRYSFGWAVRYGKYEGIGTFRKLEALRNEIDYLHIQEKKKEV